MYKKIIRPLLFELSPELIHRIVVVMLRVVHYVPGARQLLRTCFTVRHPSLEREVFGIKFPNPVGIAAGFDKDAEVYDELLSLGLRFYRSGDRHAQRTAGQSAAAAFACRSTRR